MAKGNGKGGCLTVIVVLVAVGIVISMIQGMVGYHGDSDYIAAAHDAVQNELKSPSTASFCGNDNVSKDSDDNRIITGCVNAQNSFGATVEVDYTVTEDSDTNVTNVDAQNRN